ncbi:hypothetical protein [Solirubrobacter soli]|uniref:hypothetical protein n=1 Tax=Solirubrobacter soli TaxID=363832 RepID=UPI0004069713|nr:hypothetical protein [Solirubrobacter soli]
MAADDRVLITAIVLARLALPLLIPRIPLMILVALVLDAVDGSLLAHLSSVDVGPDGPYQSFDKALDIYYLAIAYLAAMRNWTSTPAFRIARFLFYYRLVGVVAFELLDSRAMLLLFPNTFEFFFIAYEGLRTRWEPERWSGRFWLYVAGGIWVFIKLPQEYWIHVAQLDFTDAVADHPWFGVLCLLGLGVLAWLVWFVVRPRMPEPRAGWRFEAPPVPPTQAADASWSALAEKSVLLTLLAVIVAEILPSVHLSALDIALGVVALVAANLAIASWRGPGVHFALLLAINFLLIYAGSRALSDRGNLPAATGLFFAYLTTLIVVLYDTYRPIRASRDRRTDRPGAPTPSHPGSGPSANGSGERGRPRPAP